MAEHSGFEKLVSEAKKNIHEISPQEAAAKSQSGEAVIVDVREKDEWDEEHIPKCDASESWHNRVRDRRKSSRPKRNDHLSLRRRRPVRARCREPAKNGLQKRAINGRWLKSLEAAGLPRTK